MRITFRALTLAFFAIAAYLVVMPSYAPSVVEFHTVAPDAPSPITLAQAYADEHGLTCTTPADADLDDVFLTLAVDPADMQPSTTRIVPVDLDTALDSAGKRLVLLACTKAGE